LVCCTTKKLATLSDTLTKEFSLSFSEAQWTKTLAMSKQFRNWAGHKKSRRLIVQKRGPWARHSLSVCMCVCISVCLSLFL
jgi:hypothetical protein